MKLAEGIRIKPSKRCLVERARHEPWTLTRMVCSSCWNRFQKRAAERQLRKDLQTLKNLLEAQ